MPKTDAESADLIERLLRRFKKSGAVDQAMGWTAGTFSVAKTRGSIPHKYRAAARRVLGESSPAEDPFADLRQEPELLEHLLPLATQLAMIPALRREIAALQDRVATLEREATAGALVTERPPMPRGRRAR